MKYKLYIVKKFYIPLEVEAGSVDEAEQKGYDYLEQHEESGRFDSDDTYIHNGGEITA